MEFRLAILTLLTCVHSSVAQYEDVRCKCICPSPLVVSPNTTVPTVGPIPASTLKSIDVHTTKSTISDKPQRSVYIDNTNPQNCNCEWVVLPKIPTDVQLKAKEFCPLCECKYESRNISTIRWVVTLSIGIICCLIVYMGFLMLLDPLINSSNPRARRPLYEQQIDDDQIRQSTT